MSNTSSPNVGGMMNEKVALRKVRGEILLKNRPPQFRENPTEKQAVVQANFLRAAKYAKRQISMPESNALYVTGIIGKKNSAYLVAMTDCLNAPVVNSIDVRKYRGAIGDPIVVDAVDDFMVTQVLVIIRDAAGAIIEQGDAGPDSENIHAWQYKATVANASLAGTKIQAVAYDRPGNTGTLEVVL